MAEQATKKYNVVVKNTFLNIIPSGEDADLFMSKSAPAGMHPKGSPAAAAAAPYVVHQQQQIEPQAESTIKASPETQQPKAEEIGTEESITGDNDSNGNSNIYYNNAEISAQSITDKASIELKMLLGVPLVPESASTPPPLLPAATQQQQQRNAMNDQRYQKIMSTEFGHSLQDPSDFRTTLMIKNIPNKYSQKMLLESLDKYKGQFDFFYLPIDFKNKCNVGYAFINFIRRHYIHEFFVDFEATTWEKFNSQKVCAISYARIQGKNSMVAHFSNSRLLAEDRKCRPLIFATNGDFAGEEEEFPVGPNVSFNRSGPSSYRGGRSYNNHNSNSSNSYNESTGDPSLNSGNLCQVGAGNGFDFGANANNQSNGFRNKKKNMM